jgi:uncharacterized protein with von Willebrand factor type A (vWA) domain
VASPTPRAADFSSQVLSFAEELRAEGLAVGTSELLDAFSALGEVPWTERADFKEALAATLAKSQEDRRVFDLIFDRFFFRAAEAEAVDREVREEGGIDASDAQLHRPRCAAGPDRAGAARRQRRGDARPGAPGDRRVRAPGRRLGRDRRRRAAHPPLARAARRAAAGPAA